MKAMSQWRDQKRGKVSDLVHKQPIIIEALNFSAEFEICKFKNDGTTMKAKKKLLLLNCCPFWSKSCSINQSMFQKMYQPIVLFSLIPGLSIQFACTDVALNWWLLRRKFIWIQSGKKRNPWVLCRNEYLAKMTDWEMVQNTVSTHVEIKQFFNV